MNRPAGARGQAEVKHQFSQHGDRGENTVLPQLSWLNLYLHALLTGYESVAVLKEAVAEADLKLTAARASARLKKQVRRHAVVGESHRALYTC